MALANQTIKQILIGAKVLTVEEFDTAEREATRSGIPVARILIAGNRITQQRLLELESAFLNIPIFKPTDQPLRLDLIGVLPETIARQKQVLVFARDAQRNTYQVAMEDPTDIENISFIKEYLKGEIQPYLASPDSLRLGYQLYKRRSSETFETLIADKIRAVRTSLKRADENILESIPLVELLDTIIGYGAILDASDIYLQPEEDQLKIRFRVDGLLRDIITVDRAINDGLVARIKTIAGLRIDEHYRPQDGRFRFRSSDVDLDIRVAIMPTIFGEKTTLRLLASSHAFLTFEELGMNEVISKQLHDVLHRPHGMILSTGPTGSGKTTTIYAILYLLNKPEVHIVTIEDPIEYIIPNVSQTQVNPVAGITFASGLRSMLRHSPDTIVVGEIRDPETVDISVNAALTGHLLISTLHTNDAPSAVLRLVDLGVPPFLVAATLNAVVAQRLVRKVCANCRVPYTPDPAYLKKVESDFEVMGQHVKLPQTMYRGSGCAICHGTGYEGRIGLFEIFVVNEKVRDLIASKGIGADELRRVAKDQGMVAMFEDGLRKAAGGLTTIEELMRVTRD